MSIFQPRIAYSWRLQLMKMFQLHKLGMTDVKSLTNLQCSTTQRDINCM
jgi:hypothetical protein